MSAMRYALAVLCVRGEETPIDRLIKSHYPSQYLVQRLKSGQSIHIDGHLEEDAWAEVPWLENFLDLAGPRFDRWEEASRDYARRFTGSANPTRVKLRWDETFLYVAAELQSRSVAASVTGHCADLHSSVWPNPVLPYFDDDFEVFIDASQSNYFYVEFEMNARNASYSTLWSQPQAGLGSVAPECGRPGSGLQGVCCNTTWNGGKGLCDHDVEREGEGWTMEMFTPHLRPGTGMVSATSNDTKMWVLEIRFPILSSEQHGGLLNHPARQRLPHVAVEELHPGRGQRFWWATFANALHAPWWSSLTAADTQHPQLIKKRCEAEILGDKERFGFSQFLLDANNAAPTCYYEAASQNLGGHQYMHNPDVFGYLQFAEAAEASCQNVFWLSRFILAQVYQAEVQFLIRPDYGNGAFTSSFVQLLSPAVCDISNACNASALQIALDYVDLAINADTSRSGSCVRYAIPGVQNSSWTGGPCFEAHVSYTIQRRGDPSKRRLIQGSINEARLMSLPNVGQRWNDPDADWLCLGEVEVLPAGTYV